MGCTLVVISCVPPVECLQQMALHPCMLIFWVSVLCGALLSCIVLCVALTVLCLSWSWLLLCRDRQFTLVPIMVGAISTDRSVWAASCHPVRSCSTADACGRQ